MQEMINSLESKISWGTAKLLDSEVRINQCIFFAGKDISKKRYEYYEMMINKEMKE
jgi:hypothetical protein